MYLGKSPLQAYRGFEEAVSKAEETNVRGEEEVKEIQRRIKTRLESLARMYADNKDRQAEEETEERES